MASGDELIRFIGSTFRSVWALEVLGELRKRPGVGVAPGDLVTALRASELIVGQSLAELSAAGLVQLAAGGEAKYAPATPDLDRLAAAAEARYASAPNAVRRIIINTVSPDLAAFANAFRLRDKP